MRSRYSAYARGLVDYLEQTTSRRGWSEAQRTSLRDWCRDVTWLSLQVLEAHDDGATGEVRFIARSLEGGELVTLEERSAFERREGRWVYLEGLSTSPIALRTKVERNESCPCGSGQKFKRCHSG